MSTTQDATLQLESVPPWEKAYVCGGVFNIERNPPSAPTLRTRCAFRKQGPAFHIGDINSTIALETNWCTLGPPESWDDPDKDWAEILWNKGWVVDGDWKGPQEKGTATKGKGRYAGQLVSPEWNRILEDPDGFNLVRARGEESPITRLAEQVVTDYKHFNIFDDELTIRRWKMRQLNIRNYKLRTFCSDPDEAMKRSSFHSCVVPCSAV